MHNTVAELIEGLSEFLDIDTTPDTNDTCSFIIDDRVPVQLEPVELESAIIIGCAVAELPPGTFRRHILKDALRANYALKARSGILSYIEQANQLVLYTELPTDNLTSEELFTQIAALVERTKLWQDAIREGRSHPDAATEMPAARIRHRPDPFGLR